MVQFLPVCTTNLFLRSLTSTLYVSPPLSREILAITSAGTHSWFLMPSSIELMTRSYYCDTKCRYYSKPKSYWSVESHCLFS
jgi:hypothetical protein